MSAKPVPPKLVDHYAKLGVPQGATSLDVKRAYFTLAKRHHPDKADAAASNDAVEFRAVSLPSFAPL
jgi:curved DNA-binding protein CbpA